MNKKRKRIGFVLLSNSIEPQPSTRVSVLNMIPRLEAAGYDTLIAYEPTTAQEKPNVSGLSERMQTLGVDIVFFQKVHGPSVFSEILALRQAGIKTVYGVCDRIDEDMVRITDITVTVTSFLKQQYPEKLQPRIHVVHDGIEHPELFRSNSSCCDQPGHLRAVLVTSATLETIPIFKKIPNFLELTVIGRYPLHRTMAQKIRERISRALHHPNGPSLSHFLFGKGFRVMPWHPECVYDEMLQANIGIIPVDMRYDPLPEHDISYWQVKSENRLTLKMALGLPVIASPVPAYLDIIQQGVNGYIAYTQKDWLEALHELRDPRQRKRVGEAARATVLDAYSMDAQAAKLITALDTIELP